MRDLGFNSIYGSDHSDVNPQVKGIIDIAANSKTIEECSDLEKSRKDTKECMNNMERARKSSYVEVAQEVKAKAERARIEARRKKDLNLELDRLSRADDFGIGEGR